MELVRITDLSGKMGEYARDILVGSFPPEEYRELGAWEQMTCKQRNFYNNVVVKGERNIGLLTYWDFDVFVYVEHFAIDPSLRGGGYGSEILSRLVQMVKKPVVLEVERPLTEEAKRRIAFYQRNGFALWKNDYQQPPYRVGDPYLPMYLMACGDMDENEYYTFVRTNIYSEVYHCR